LSIRTAVKTGKRPTCFILRSGNANGAWKEYDYLLAEALEILDSEYCQMCSQPKWLCHSDSDEIQFRITDDHCYASERIEKKQKANAEKKNYDGAGVRLVAVPYSTTGKPLSEYREPYFRELIKKHQERQAESEGVE
jgi:hypothetical protein